jgi:hypothetical protein
MTIRPVTFVSTLLLVGAGALPVCAQQLEKPPPGYTSPTIYRAGPSWLTAAAVVPTRLDLQWASVAGAGFYQIKRSSSAEPAEILVNEIPSEPPDPTGFYLDNLPPRSGSVKFSYKVLAVWVGTDGSRTYSEPSQIATVTALPPVAPANLKWQALPSQLQRRLKVTFSWDPAPGATGYYVFQIARPPTRPLPMIATTVKQNSFAVDNVIPGQGGTVCVVTVYEIANKDESVRSCVLVLTRTP